MGFYSIKLLLQKETSNPKKKDGMKKKKREDAAKVMYAGIKYSLVWLGDFNMANVRHVMLILL